MTFEPSPASRARSPWLAPVLRAVPALAVGLIITFTADHSPTLGLTMLGAFGLATALVLLAASLRTPATEPTRALHRGLAIIAGIAGALALVVLATVGGGLPLLLLLVGGYAVLAGALELVWGIRHRDRSPIARDAVVIGVGTLALAIVLALVGDPVSAVGFFGAYAVVLGVFLLIAGLSLKWTPPVKESPAS
jgi:peptidoglycan/LPS O-acetylase OafA/YrhL